MRKVAVALTTAGSLGPGLDLDGLAQFKGVGAVVYVVRRAWCHRGRPCTARYFRLDSPVKNPRTDPFQTPSQLGHPSYPNAPKVRSPKLP